MHKRYLNKTTVCIAALGCLLFISPSLHAQILYGTTALGGSNGLGTIIKYDVPNNINTVVHTFIKDAYISNDIFRSSSGTFYATASGGALDSGVIYSIDPATENYKVLYNFNKPGGGIPAGKLMEASNGKLFGTTTAGGAYNKGVIFSFDPVSLSYSKLKDLNNTNGSPMGLVQASNGKLYGMTTGYTSDNKGIMYSFDPVTSEYVKLKDFKGPDGKFPDGELIAATDGNLYGLTHEGGKYNHGVLFSFNPQTQLFYTVKDFNITAAYFSPGGLLQAADGRLYGTIVDNYGRSTFTFFVDPVSLAYKTYKTNHWTTNFIKGVDGKLYASGYLEHAIYSFDPDTGIYKTYNTPDQLRGSLVQSLAGKIFGMDDQSIFSLDPATSAFKELTEHERINGIVPQGGLLKARDGKLYGTTNRGGAKGDGSGVFFSFDPVTLNYSKLKDFDGVDGVSPGSTPVQTDNGKLYGVTAGGGVYDSGVIFSIDPVSKIFTRLKDFNHLDGTHPTGLIKAADGKLYGMTWEGGSKNNGVIFSYDPATTIYTVLKEFDGINGSHPLGTPIQATDGMIYGVTNYGGLQNRGILFSFNPVTSAYMSILSGDLSHGYEPENIIQGRDGKLYGTAFVGSGKGVIFSYDPKHHKFKRLFSGIFSSTGPLLQVSDSLLYCTGNNHNDYYHRGFIYSFNIKTNSFSELLYFTGQNGSNPNAPLTYYTNSEKISTSQAKFDRKIIAPNNLFTIKASPNPSSSAFRLAIQSSSDKEVEIFVTDLPGRIVYKRKGSAATPCFFGSTFAKGIYIVRVTQGGTTQTLRLQKGGR